MVMIAVRHQPPHTRAHPRRDLAPSLRARDWSPVIEPIVIRCRNLPTGQPRVRSPLGLPETDLPQPRIRPHPSTKCVGEDPRNLRGPCEIGRRNPQPRPISSRRRHSSCATNPASRRPPGVSRESNQPPTKSRSVCSACGCIATNSSCMNGTINLTHARTPGGVIYLRRVLDLTPGSRHERIQPRASGPSRCTWRRCRPCHLWMALGREDLAETECNGPGGRTPSAGRIVLERAHRQAPAIFAAQSSAALIS
ncbi:hypothetical protein GFS60_06246 (plasmid) [Rhodococcus sp. WAY2]|nr:hypothetical protein GFS60_06246 [Rhodococcus sp. WAY2]